MLFLLSYFWHVKLRFISLNLPDCVAWNTVFMSRLLFLFTTLTCWASHRNKYVVLLVLHMLLFEHLTYCRNVASLSLLYRYCFGRCSCELAELVPFPFFSGQVRSFSNRLHDFSVTIARCYKGVYINNSFLLAARFWNPLPV